MKIKLSFTIIFLIFLIASCSLLGYQGDEKMDTLTLINLSDKDLLFEEMIFKQSFDTLIQEMAVFNDTKYYEEHTLKARDTVKFKTWMTANFMDYFVLFYYDENIVNTIPWDTIRTKYMVLKRYDLSIEDLERMNWTITYP